MGGITYFTSNGGANWSSFAVTSSADLVLLRDVFVLNSTTAFVFGHEFYLAGGAVGLIYKTTNSGVNWFHAGNGGNMDHTAMNFKNETTGYIFGPGNVNRTTNAGASWSFYSEVPLAGRPSQIFNDTFYVGKIRIYNPITDGRILKTVNGGASFTYYPLGRDIAINSLSFLNNSYGYAAGDSGSVYKTTNGGLNWLLQESGTRRRLSTVVFFNKDTGIAMGDSGIVLRTVNGGLTGITSNTGEIPAEYSLFQNYPNPFNPSTVIRYSIPSAGDVRLNIYDASGKLVKELVNARQPAGVHEAILNAGQLASGMYFYTLTAGEYKETRKMVLVK